MIVDEMLSILERFRKEDEEWRNVFNFLEKDEYEVNELEEDLKRLMASPPEENPGEFCVEVVEFIENDFIKFLDDQRNELREMMNSPEAEKVERRAGELVTLIQLAEELIERTENISRDKSNSIKNEKRKRIKKLSYEMRRDISGLEDYEDEFKEMKNKAAVA